ncbi:MAG: hypothetical protein ACXVAY_00255 [Mucilaginibacter sp.]
MSIFRAISCPCRQIRHTVFAPFREAFAAQQKCRTAVGTAAASCLKRQIQQSARAEGTATRL